MLDDLQHPDSLIAMVDAWLYYRGTALDEQICSWLKKKKSEVGLKMAQVVLELKGKSGQPDS